MTLKAKRKGSNFEPTYTFDKKYWFYIGENNVPITPDEVQSQCAAKGMIYVPILLYAIGDSALSRQNGLLPEWDEVRPDDYFILKDPYMIQPCTGNKIQRLA